MKRLRAISFCICLCLVFLCISALSVFASPTDGTIDPLNSTALGLSPNVGSINFAATNGDVHVTDTVLTGSAWSENFGWINLAPPNGGVTNDSEGNLSGFAWGENAGWVNFKPTNGGVTIDDNGIFHGYAWAQNFGWISFNCADNSSCGTENYKVETDWRPASIRNNPGGPGGGPGGGGMPSVLVKMYACPAGTVVSRAVNGPSSSGSITVPADCTPAAGLSLGTIYEPGVNNYLAPYPGLTDTTAFTFAGNTDANGSITVSGGAIPGRQDFAELYGQTNRIPDSDYLGFYCQNETGPSGGRNYASEVLSSSVANQCVAYRLNDVCPNISGIQSVLPQGWSFNASGNCVQPQGSVDVCPNIPGIQTSIPAGMVINAVGSCVAPEQCQLLPSELKQSLDVMVVIDVSGSMAGSRITNAISAAQYFVNSLAPATDRAGLVSYSTTATLKNKLTSNMGAVNASIQGLKADGNTDIGDGMELAANELTADGRTDAKKVIVLLSDGFRNVPGNNPADYAITQSNTAKTDGYTVYSIGLGAKSIRRSWLLSLLPLPTITMRRLRLIFRIYISVFLPSSVLRVRQRWGGEVFNDANDNGLLDASETGLSGFTINVSNAYGSLILKSTSDSSGQFAFTNVTAGTYQICLNSVAGWRQTVPVRPLCYTTPITQGVDVSALYSDFSGIRPPRRYSRRSFRSKEPILSF